MKTLPLLSDLDNRLLGVQSSTPLLRSKLLYLALMRLGVCIQNSVNLDLELVHMCIDLSLILFVTLKIADRDLCVLSKLFRGQVCRYVNDQRISSLSEKVLYLIIVFQELPIKEHF